MKSLEEVRGEIAEIDREIISLIGKRTAKARDVLKAKQAMGRGVNDDEQNQIILERAVDMAVENDLDAGAVKKIFEKLIEMNIQRQHDLRGENNLP